MGGLADRRGGPGDNEHLPLGHMGLVSTVGDLHSGLVSPPRASLRHAAGASQVAKVATV